MHSYNSYCTKEQTEKAMKLGAPIYTTPYFSVLIHEVHNFFVKDDTCYYFPTTEQMIGWLEDGVFREVNVQEFANYWEYNLYTTSDDVVSHKGYFHSRKEATIAAIDAALNYLSSQKTNSNKD